MDHYYQFCPLAIASELVTQRWTPLVLRELLIGSTRFNDLRRGIPRISRTLLAQRLRDLADAGVVERVEVDGHPEYRLTAAGEELRPIVMQLSVWGKRWMKGELDRERMDAGFLMWDVHRRIERDRLPPGRVVVAFHFTDAPDDYRDWWLVLERDAIDLCLADPGYGCDLDLSTDLRTMIDVWMGDADLHAALRSESVRLSGRRELRRQFPGWLGLSALAGTARMR